MKHLHCAIIRALASILLLASFSVIAQQGSTIKLGQSLPLTGPLTELGSEYRDGATAYFKWVNSKGGVNGRKIELLTLDDAYVVDKTVANARKLLDEDNVFAFFGMFGSANYAALLPLINERSVPSIAPYTGADSLRTANSPTTFWLRASYGDEVEKLVQHLTTLGVPRISVLWMNNGFGKDGLAGARKSMEKRGLKLHSDAPIQADSSDVQQAVQSLSAGEPDAIIMITAGAPTVTFIKAYRKVSRAARFYTTSVMGSQSTIQALGPDGVGVVVTSVVPFPWSQSLPVAREYRDVLKKAGMQESVSFIGLETFINARVLVEGLRRAGKDLTRPRFIQAMESLQHLDVGGFEVDFGKGVRQGSRFVDLTIIGTGGKFTR